MDHLTINLHKLINILYSLICSFVFFISFQIDVLCIKFSMIYMELIIIYYCSYIAVVILLVFIT